MCCCSSWLPGHLPGFLPAWGFPFLRGREPSTGHPCYMTYMYCVEVNVIASPERVKIPCLLLVLLLANASAWRGRSVLVILMLYWMN